MKNKKIILASNSPRRKELLQGLDIAFEVKVLKGIDESYPSSLPKPQIAEFIATKKADAYKPNIKEDEIIITADTIVVCEDEIMGKPKDEEDAKRMLHKLSGCTHQVITGVCLTTNNNLHSFSVITNVTFDKLSQEDIEYYVNTYNPLDKAGAYGIQEWIGHVGVSRIEGSYFNVVGLPVQRIYKELQKI